MAFSYLHPLTIAHNPSLRRFLFLWSLSVRTVLPVLDCSILRTNMTAVLSILADFVLGFNWYSTWFMGPYMKAMHADKGGKFDMAIEKMLPNVLIGLLCTIAQSFVLAHLFVMGSVHNPTDALLFAGWIFVGIAVPTYLPTAVSLGNAIILSHGTQCWANRPNTLHLINGAFYLARIVLALQIYADLH